MAFSYRGYKIDSNVYVSGDSYTVTPDDEGKTIVFDSDDPVTVTVPDGMENGDDFTVINNGSGDITINPSDGNDVLPTPTPPDPDKPATVTKLSNAWWLEQEGQGNVMTLTVNTALGMTLDVNWDTGCAVNWGDDTADETKTHTYTATGEFTVKVAFGSATTSCFVTGDCLTAIVDFGINTPAQIGFYETGKTAPNLTNVPNVLPASITTGKNMFRETGIGSGNNMMAWNTAAITDMSNMFNGCPDFTGGYIGGWDTSNVTDMSGMFYNAGKFRGPINAWDVSAVVTFANMFRNAYVFNWPINNWDVGAGVHFDGMFQGTEAFNQPLNNWDVSKATGMIDMFKSTKAFNQDISDWNVPLIATRPSGFRDDAPQFTLPDPWSVFMELTADTSKQFLTVSGNNISSVQWGDGDVTYAPVVNVTHKYAPGSSGQVKVKIMVDRPSTGPMFISNDALISVDKWGFDATGPTTVSFKNSPNLKSVPNSLPTCVEALSSMFKNCPKFNSALNDWDTSNISNFNSCFYGCSSFNQSLDNWDVSGATTETELDYMFFNCSVYNQDLSDWDVSAVPVMPEHFMVGANNWTEATPWTKYDLPIIKVDTSKGRNVYYSGDRATIDWGDGTIDQNVLGQGHNYLTSVGQTEIKIYSSYDVPKDMRVGGDAIVELMQFGNVVEHICFGAPGASAGGRESPNLTKVPEKLGPSIITTENMFTNATSFNQDLSTWDTSNVTSMNRMFDNAAAFNQNLSAWDTSNVTGMQYMFRGATAFNQDLSTWDTSNVTSMRFMFGDTATFNQDLSAWDTSNVTDMIFMFDNAAAFNQDLSAWCVSNITSKPTGFDIGANSWTLPRPVWGTCP